VAIRKMTTITYRVMQPPFTLNFSTMSKRELRDYYQWFRDAIPRRIAELTGAVNSSSNFKDWKADHRPSSLDDLGVWFATEVEARPRTQEGKIATQSPFPQSSRELTNRTISLAVDIAKYLGEVLIRNHSSLRWDQIFGSKKSIDYGQPVVVGFVDEIARNPVRAVTTSAYGLMDKTYTGKRLHEVYDAWLRCVAK
jgi:hypothetical protein